MAVVPPGTLKGYFNAGDVPSESNYVDLIDSLGIPTTSVLATGSWDDYKETGFYRGSNLTNSPTVAWYYVLVQRHDDNYVSQTAFYYYANVVYHRVCSGGSWTSWNLVFPAQWNDVQYKPTQFTPTAHTHAGGDITSAVGDSSKLGNVAAANYLQRTSANRPGVTRLYRDDTDSGYYLRHYWTGTHWYLQGYLSGAYHAGVRVALADSATSATNADTVDSLHASSFLRKDTADTATGPIQITNDMRVTGGISVGANLDVSTGHIWFNDSNLRIYDSGSNYLRIYNNYGTGDIGVSSINFLYIGTSTQGVNINGVCYVNGSIVAGANGLFASNAGSVSNAIQHVKHANDSHVWLTNASNGNYWIHYYGNSTYTRTVRIGNGAAGYGNIHADNFVNESRRASKRNIRSYKANALDLVDQLEPVTYHMINGADKGKGKDRIGFIAEEIAEVLPEVVAFDEDGNPDGIAYGQIVPLLVSAIKELRSQVKELQHGNNV